MRYYGYNEGGDVICTLYEILIEQSHQEYDLGIHTWDMRNVYKILIENLKRRELEVDKRTISDFHVEIITPNFLLYVWHI
jgi:hypothetical protein